MRPCEFLRMCRMYSLRTTCGLPHLRLGRLLAIGDRFINNTAHDAGIGDFGVAEFAVLVHARVTKI